MQSCCCLIGLGLGLGLNILVLFPSLVYTQFHNVQIIHKYGIVHSVHCASIRCNQMYWSPPAVVWTSLGGKDLKWGLTPPVSRQIQGGGQSGWGYQRPGVDCNFAAPKSRKMSDAPLSSPVLPPFLLPLLLALRIPHFDYKLTEKIFANIGSYSSIYMRRYHNLSCIVGVSWIWRWRQTQFLSLFTVSAIC